MNSITKAIKNKVKDVGTAVKEVSTIPYNMYKAKKFSGEAKMIQMARNGKEAPAFDASGNVTDAFKARTLAKAIKNKYKDGGVK
jgi:hypothetical protein